MQEKNKNTKKGLLVLALLGAILVMGGCASYNAKTGQATHNILFHDDHDAVARFVRRVVPVDEAKELSLYKALSNTVPASDLAEPGAFIDVCLSVSLIGIKGYCGVVYVLNKEIRPKIENDDIVGVLMGKYMFFGDNTRYQPGDVARVFQLIAKHDTEAAEQCWRRFPPPMTVTCRDKADHKLVDYYFKKYPPTVEN